MRIVGLLASISLVIASISAECDPKSCPHRYYLSHYTELGCTPLYEDPETCCPARFDCSSRQNIAVDRCHYEGTEFKIGETLPENLTPTCLVNCRCVQDYMNETLAVANCVNIECPEDFMGPPEPGCVPLYEEKECCSTDMFCGNETEATVTCAHGGNTYVKGQKFYPEEEPCKTCICQAGFNGSLIEPYCETAKCNVELHYSSQINRHCVPVYYQDRCCPIDWICPDDIDVSKIQIQKNPSHGNREGCLSNLSGNNVCHFGSLKFEQGEQLPEEIAGSCVKCECAVPPVPTCVKNYSNC